MKTQLLPIALLALLPACQRGTEAGVAPAAASTASTSPRNDADLVARGEYLVRITGCNDCHTPGYRESGGEQPAKAQWLTGHPMGFVGPWGTTYAANLRIKLNEMDEAKWLDYSATLHTRPIMPDFNVRAMTTEDRRAIYRFVRSLGVAGQPAPAYQPPGAKPQAPYFELVLPAMPAAAASAPSAPATAPAGT